MPTAKPRLNQDYVKTPIPNVVRWIEGERRGQYYLIEDGQYVQVQGCIKSFAKQGSDALPLAEMAFALRRAYYKAADRSKVREQAFTLTLDDIYRMFEDQGGRCALTGVAFRFYYRGDSIRNPYTPSLDRICPSRGYDLENARLLTTIANSARADFGDHAFYEMCRAGAAQIRPIP